jgi:hypothetical protein
MTTERDPLTQIVVSWLREDAHENAERMLMRALDEVDTTPQRRSWWPAWRSHRMNTYAKLITAAAAVVLVAIVGFRFLPSNGGIGGQPTIAPSPSPALIASGDFAFPAMGATVALDATGQGSDVTGTLTVSDASKSLTVDLECALTAEDGRILIGGDTTESTNEDAPKGTRTAIVLRPGSPVQMILEYQGSDPVRAPSCMAFLEDMKARTIDLLPISGTVELGP